MESRIIEYILHSMRLIKKNIKSLVLYGNYYAEDLLVSICRELEKKSCFEIKMFLWDDYEFINDKYLLDCNGCNVEKTMLIYVREPIRNFHELIHMFHDTKMLKEKYRKWFDWSERIKQQYALVLQIDFPSDIRNKHNLNSNDLRKDFIKSCTCDYEKMFDNMLFFITS